MPSHNITRAWSDSAGRSVSGKTQFTSAGEVVVDEAFPISANFVIACNMVFSGLSTLFIKADQDVVLTLKNGAGSTVGTVSLTAGQPYIWTEDDDFSQNPIPISGDVATVSVNATVAGNLNIRILQDPTPPTIALTGTILTATEAQIVTGGRTLILTVTGDTFVPAGAAFDAVRTAIFQGIVADATPATSWNNAVQAAFIVSNVVRTSSNIVTVTTPATGSYSISADQVLSVTVPKQALVRRHAVVATPTATITAS